MGSTFGLVHGGFHGAWCWQRVIGALDALGHRGLAMDLPCSDDGAGAGEYADAVVAALADVEEPVILVGHSLAGLTIPIVARRRPVQRLIFLSALLPMPGKSLMEQQETEPEMLFPDLVGPSGFGDRLYNKATPADAAFALTQLRPQSRTPHNETSPLDEWPDVPMSFIVSSDDHACNPEWGRRAARERLGIQDCRVLEGSDHSPFMSRPAELARLLVELAES